LKHVQTAAAIAVKPQSQSAPQKNALSFVEERQKGCLWNILSNFDIEIQYRNIAKAQKRKLTQINARGLKSPNGSRAFTKVEMTNAGLC
jgi:hypothetical protein